ncbi:MAG: DNA integrity scanning diadenylate cyclase DisA [Actinomycetota bacterium]
MVKEEDEKLLGVLKTLAPGTPLRAALDQIIQYRNGALIVLGDTPAVLSIAHGGFEIDTDFAPIKLYELAKMDGAIVISSDLSKIIKANVHLVPDLSLPTSETGMRQRTAERVARQTGVPVVSISEDLGNIFLYVGDIKYILVDIRLLMARANQALQTLEKYKARLDQVISNLDTLEFKDMVTLSDVASVVQRAEMVQRVSRETERYIIELGEEGRLVRMQLDELVGSVREDYLQTVRDYCRLRGKRTVEAVMREISLFSMDELLDLENVAHSLGYRGEELENLTSPKGYRLLRRIPQIPPPVVDNIANRFGSLKRITLASVSELDEVAGVGEARARALQEGLKRLRATS